MKLDAKSYAVGQTEVARILDVSTRRVRQLVAAGRFSANEDGRYVLRDAIAGYAAALTEAAARRQSPAHEKLRTARAVEIEQRLARNDRDLVAMPEALTVLREVAGTYVDSIRGMPTLITNDPRERQRVAAICDADADRLASKTKATIAAFKSGKPDEPEEDE
ncbi:MAG: hypothetical protein EOS05_10325 [Mesorhizobium sp.]|nr:MAG: hypothetical protein EOS05_10325 [Mesorhizobium sp.]